MRYLRDLPHLKRGFAELGPKGWRDLIKGKRSKHAALIAEAWPKYLADYELSRADVETDAPIIPADAAADYMAAHAAGRVPAWVMGMALTSEIQEVVRGG